MCDWHLAEFYTRAGAAGDMRTIVTITGMSCVHCRRAVFTALAGVPGVTRAEVEIGRAEIEHDEPVDVELIRVAVAAAGYAVTESVRDRRTLPQMP